MVVPVELRAKVSRAENWIPRKNMDGALTKLTRVFVHRQPHTESVLAQEVTAWMNKSSEEDSDAMKTLLKTTYESFLRKNEEGAAEGVGEALFGFNQANVTRLTWLGNVGFKINTYGAACKVLTETWPEAKGILGRLNHFVPPATAWQHHFFPFIRTKEDVQVLAAALGELRRYAKDYQTFFAMIQSAGKISPLKDCAVPVATIVKTLHFSVMPQVGAAFSKLIDNEMIKNKDDIISWQPIPSLSWTNVPEYIEMVKQAPAKEKLVLEIARSFTYLDSRQKIFMKDLISMVRSEEDVTQFVQTLAKIMASKAYISWSHFALEDDRFGAIQKILAWVDTPMRLHYWRTIMNQVNAQVAYLLANFLNTQNLEYTEQEMVSLSNPPYPGSYPRHHLFSLFVSSYITSVEDVQYLIKYAREQNATLLLVAFGHYYIETHPFVPKPLTRFAKHSIPNC